MDIDTLAKYLAYSDRAIQTSDAAKFLTGANRYWNEIATVQLREKFRTLAKGLLSNPTESKIESKQTLSLNNPRRNMMIRSHSYATSKQEK